jgi:hypothetical protein
LPVFDPKKYFNRLSSPVLYRFISGDYILFHKLKIKLKGLHFADVATIQVAVSNVLKRVQKEEFSEAFKKLYGCAKACIYANGAYFEFKKSMCLPHVSSIKEISPETFEPHCVATMSLNLSPRRECYGNINGGSPYAR